MSAATEQTIHLAEVTCPRCHLKTRADAPCLHCRHHFPIFNCGKCHRNQNFAGQLECVFCSQPIPNMARQVFSLAPA